jgi:hypothetical protein
MPRRIATLLTSGLLLLGLLAAGLLLRVPYSEMSPGPTVNTLGDHNNQPVLAITGAETYETSGHLNMTTVRVTGVNYRMTMADALRGWLSPRSGVVPHATLYPDDRTADEVDQAAAPDRGDEGQGAAFRPGLRRRRLDGMTPLVPAHRLQRALALARARQIDEPAAEAARREDAHHGGDQGAGAVHFLEQGRHEQDRARVRLADPHQPLIAL